MSKLRQKHVGIIGGGTMGSAIARLLAAKESGSMCLIFDRNMERRKALAESSTAVAGTLDELMEKSDIVVLAVKPQDVKELFEQVYEKIKPSHLVVSIMAGISIGAIARGLGTKRVIRSMPNTPAQIGKGMTVWTANQSVDNENKEAARFLFSLLGRELEVDSEDKIDAATAVSGSGPAYLFLLAEALENGACQLGFSSKESEIIVRETLRGASELYAQSPESPAILRSRVTSKGGITEASMAVLDPPNFIDLWRRAVKRAYDRSKKLNK